MSNEDIANLKGQLIVADYKSYFDSATRVRNQITNLLNWEVGLVSAVTLYLAKLGHFNEFIIGPVVFLIIIFWYLHARNIFDLKNIGALVLIVEGRLGAKDLDKYHENIVNWEFGNTLEINQPNDLTFRKILKSGRKKTVWVIHAALILFSTAVIALSKI